MSDHVDKVARSRAADALRESERRLLDFEKRTEERLDLLEQRIEEARRLALDALDLAGGES